MGTWNINKMNSTNSADHTEVSADFCLPLHKIVFESDNNPTPEIINLILNIPTSIAAISGNLLVLVSIWNTPSLHTPSHALLFGLAIADFGVGLLAQPIFIVYFIAKINDWNDLTCKSGIIVSSVSYGFCGVSLLTLTAISLDKVLALHLHLRYNSIVTVKRVLCLLAAIWVYGTSAAALGPLLKDFIIVINISVVSMCLCVCLMVFSYLHIFRIIRRHQRQIQSELQLQARLQGQNSVNMVELKKSCLLRILICCLFFLCYLPFVIVTVWPITEHSTRQMAFELCSTVVLMGSCLNPLVFCCRLHEMRIAFRQTLRKCGCFSQ